MNQSIYTTSEFTATFSCFQWMIFGLLFGSHFTEVPAIVGDGVVFQGVWLIFNMAVPHLLVKLYKLCWLFQNPMWYPHCNQIFIQLSKRICHSISLLRQIMYSILFSEWHLLFVFAYFKEHEEGAEQETEREDEEGEGGELITGCLSVVLSTGSFTCHCIGHSIAYYAKFSQQNNDLVLHLCATVIW